MQFRRNAFWPAGRFALILILGLASRLPSFAFNIAAWPGDDAIVWAPRMALTNVIAISGGGYHSMALRADGTIVNWSVPYDGHLDLGVSNVVNIASGWCHDLALNADGTVLEWGLDSSCAGSGPFTSMPPGLSNVVAVAGGARHSLVLKSDGTCVAWGWMTVSAGYVPDGLSNVVAIAAGWDVSAALKSDGTVMAWGYTGYGGTSVPGGLTDVAAIAMGHSHGLALRSNGTVVVWGAVGPPPVTLSNVVKIAAKQMWSLASQVDGTLVTWGDNLGGQLNSPNKPLTNVVQLAAQAYSGLLLVADGPPQPLWVLSNVTALAESAVTFKGEAVGTEPLSYQWMQDGANVSGATGPTLTLTNIQPTQSGLYSVVASNAVGVVTNSGATLTVVPLLMTTQPTNQTVYGGDSATRYVAAQGVALNYQWRQYGTNLPGATNAQLLIPTVTTNHAGDYSVIVSNSYGWLESSNSSLAVIPLEIIYHPPNRSVYVGEGTTFVVTVLKNGPFTYQWRFDGADLPDKTNASLALSNLGTNNGGNYSVVVFNPYGVTESSNAMLTVVDSAPFITLQPASQGTWLGSSANFYVNANGSKPLGYQWRKDGVPIAGATNSALALTGVSTNEAGFYSVLVSNSVSSLVSSDAALALVPVAQWAAFSLGTLPASLTNAVVIATGSDHNLAIKSDGTVAAWLGYSVVPSSATNVVALAAGAYQSLALRSDGTLVAWGSTFVPANASNIVGIAVSQDSDRHTSLAIKSDGTVLAWGNVPAINNVPLGLNSVVEVAAGRYHALALKSDGRLTAWTDYLDYGNNSIPSGLSNVLAISTGVRHSLALRSNGTVVAWGQTQLAPAGLSNVVAISAGADHNLALRSDGAIVTWGPSGSPTNVPNSVSNVIGTAGGWSHSLALLGSTDLTFARQPRSVARPPRNRVMLSVGVVSRSPVSYQWQFNGADIPSATNAVHLIGALSEVEAGNYRVIASNTVGVLTSATAQVTMAGNSVLAWGKNSTGQTNGPAGLSAVAIAGGASHSIALRPDGTVAAWGPSTYSVTNVPASATNVIAIAAGNNHNLALKLNGTVVAWGDSSSGKTTVPASATNVVAITAGNYYSLALKSDGKLVKWGSLPFPPGSLSNVVAIAGGYYHGLGLKSDSSVVSWGSGSGLTSGLSNIVAVAAGNNFSLALTSNGNVIAWGSIAAPPAGLSNVVAIAAGGSHALALNSDGTTVAWGNNTYNQTNVPAGLSNVVAVAGGDAHSLLMIGSEDPAIVRQPAPVYASVFNRVLLSVGAISSRPLTFQWRFNGADIPDETNSWFYLPAVRTDDSGNYSVVVSNELGSVTSSGAAVSAVEVPPFILTHPSSQAVSNTAPVTLSVLADGSEPLTFQWLKNGAAYAGATNPNLTFANPRRSDGGYYSMSVSNAIGSVLSAEAKLRVLVPQQVGQPRPLPDGSVALSSGDSDGGMLETNDLPFFTVWASANLVEWELLPDVLTVSNGLLCLRDYTATNHPQRFYRIAEKLAWRMPVPQILAEPSLQPGGSRLLMFGESDGTRLTPADLAKFEVWASPDLTTWQKLTASLTLTNGRVWLLDNSAASFPQRFYRVIEVP